MFAVISLAVGLGVTTTAYSLIFTTLWPSHVPHEDRLALLMRPPTAWNRVISGPDFEDFAASQHSFGQLAATTRFQQSFFRSSGSMVVRGEAVSGSYFQALGADVELGRALQPADDRPGAEPVVILGHRFWRQQLGADATLLNGIVQIGGQPFRIVGVAADDFLGMASIGALDTQVWIPLTAAPGISSRAPYAIEARNRARGIFTVVGRLRDGISVEQASLEAALVSQRLDQLYPLRSARSVSGAPMAVPRSWSARTIRDVRRELLAPGWSTGVAMLLLIVLVLGVACTNLANLTLARNASRQREIAVRRALGSSRARLIRGQLAESVLLAGCGGLLAFVIIRILFTLWAIEVPVARAYTIRLDPQLDPGALVAAGLGLLLSMGVFGLWPAIRLSRADVRSALVSEGGAFATPRWRARRSLISWQVTVAVGFFLIAVACIRQAAFETAGGDPGLDLDRLGVATVSTRMQEWPDEQAQTTLTAVVELTRQQPRVERAALLTSMPFGTWTEHVSLAPAGQEALLDADATGAYFIGAGTDAFETMGVPILRGRPFDATDTPSTAPVAVLSELTARALFGSSNVVGRQVVIERSRRLAGRESRTVVRVVGVAQDTDTGSGRHRRRTGLAYVPLSQHDEPAQVIAARGTGGPGEAAAAIRDAVRIAAPELAIVAAGPSDVMLGGPQVLLRLLTWLVTGLGAVTLILAMTGLYGVQADLVSRRTREIGLRMALGAASGRIAWMVVRDSFRPVLDGLALGLIAGTVGRGILQVAIPESVSLFDPLAVAIVPIPLVLAAGLACYLPARRASRVQPTVALRDL